MLNDRELLERSVALLQRGSAPAGNDDRRRTGPRSFGEWMKNPALLAPLSALIPGLAFVGRCSLLSAREKTGKSTLLAQAVAALTTGGTFLGDQLQRRIVLWYCLDEPIADCIRRFKEMGGDPESLIISTERPTAPEMRAEAETTEASLVVVDTLTELWRGMIRSENDADEVAGFLDPYIRNMRELDISLTFSHHSPKSSRGYRGSTATGAKVDVLLSLRRPGTGAQAEDLNENEEDPETDDGRRILEGRGRGVPHYVHRLSFDGQRYSLGEAPLPLRARILQVLAQDGATTRSIRERVRGKSQRISEMLTELETENVIRRSGSHWTLIEGGSPSGSLPQKLDDREPHSEQARDSQSSAGTAPEPGRSQSGTSREPRAECSGSRDVA